MAVFVFPPISLSSGPVQFNLNGVATVVSKDTVTPANSKALPVELTGASGPINITAGDLNVQLSDQGANPDVTRIGDGTNQLAITAGNAAKVDGSAVTQPISAASLPLPSGAATEAKQDTGNTSLSNIDGKIPANLTVTSTRLLVDGSGVTQPVSGTFFQATQPVSAASLPLPTGAATEAKQDTQITIETTIATNTTNLNNTIAAEGGTQPTHGLVVMGHTGAGVARHIRVDTNGILSANIISSALPTGAATETTLSSLNSKIPGSLTVTSTRLLVDGSGVTQPVSGSVSITNLPASQTVDGTVAVSNLPAALGQTTMAASTSVTIASDQTAIPTTPGALTASFQEVLNLTTVAQTVTPPASAKWVKIYADNTNSNNIRVRLAGTATTSSGISMEPGRTEDFSVVGTGISIIAEAGTNQKINFTFGA